MKTKITSISISLFLIIAAIAGSAALVKNKDKADKNLNGAAPISVKTQIVNNELLKTIISYPGRVNSAEVVSLSAEVNGKILNGKVPFKEGQSFTKDDLLIQIYDEDANANLKASKSNFLRTISKILPDLNVDFPESFDKWNRFFSSINFNSLLPELPEIKEEKERIFLASNGVLSEYYSIQQQEINFQKYKIYAPFDGYFKNVNKEVGAIAGNGVELAQIIRSDKLEIVVPVSAADSKKVTTDQQVVLKAGANKLIGNVSRIAGFVDQTTQSVNVYINYYSGHAGELLEGEYVIADFEINNKVKGIKIPREAVSEHSVYIVEEGKLKLSEVKLVQQLEDQTLISGLDDGDILVVESLINVEEGQKVGAIK